MAHKGSLNGQHLLSEETWEEMHSEPKEMVACPEANVTFFTKGGVNLFTHTDRHSKSESPYFISEMNITS